MMLLASACIRTLWNKFQNPPFIFGMGAGGVWKGISVGRRREAPKCSVTGPRADNDGNRNAEWRMRTGGGTPGRPAKAERVVCKSITLFVITAIPSFTKGEEKANTIEIIKKHIVHVKPLLRAKNART